MKKSAQLFYCILRVYNGYIEQNNIFGTVLWGNEGPTEESAEKKK